VGDTITIPVEIVDLYNRGGICNKHI